MPKKDFKHNKDTVLPSLAKFYMSNTLKKYSEIQKYVQELSP